MEIPTFKCIIVGDGGVGKTSFIKKHLTGEFLCDYDATLGVEIHPLIFNTNIGYIRFNIWDCAGQKKFRGLASAHYVNADCAIVMYDTTNRSTYDNLGSWYNEIRSICGLIPIMTVGNKFDNINSDTEHIEMYCNISSMMNYNIEKPFMELIRNLLNNRTIQFVN
jgi:GTP-binding nuclear protein Ran